MLSDYIFLFVHIGNLCQNPWEWIQVHSQSASQRKLENQCWGESFFNYVHFSTLGMMLLFCFFVLYGESYVTMPLHTHARKHTHSFINHHVLRLPENTVCPFPCFCWADTLMSSVCECMHFWYQKLKQTNITKKKNNAYCFYGHLRISSVQHYRKYIYRIWAVKCSVLSHNLTSKQNIMKWLR